jgi:dolichol-phosphate mannosyltransferase
MQVMYSVIIPAHNEAENLPGLLHELDEVMTNLQQPWEVIVVDDGSTDATWPFLEKEAHHLQQLQGVQLKKQSGQTAALLIGIQTAKGQIVITLDGDGQNDPHDIPRLLSVLRDADCVSGWRVDRQDSWHKKLTSRIANTMRRWVLVDSIHDTGCSLKVYKTPCFANVKLFKGMHRFLPSLLMIEGYQVKEIPVADRARKRGKSNYSFLNRGFSTISDLLAVWWMKRRTIHVEIKRRTQGRFLNTKESENDA